MMRKFFFLALICLSVTNIAVAIEDPWKILVDAHQASKTLNYQGIFHLKNFKEIQSMEITHAMHGQDEYTRMTLMDGEPGELLSHGKNTFVYHSNENNVVIQKRAHHHLFPSVLPSSPENLKKVYTLSFGQVERVADRMAQMLILIPKDDFRHQYHFWIDQETALPLKMIVSNKSNEVIEQASFIKLKIIGAEKDLSWFKPRIDLSKEYVMDEKEEVILPGLKFWTFRKVPKGFSEMNATATRNKEINVLSHHLIYSDGLSYISVFIQPVQTGLKPKVGSISMEGTNVSATYYRGYQVMAVGTVPMSTLESFTKSISF